MSKIIDKILLIDDDEVLNFINETILIELDITKEIVVKSNGKEGLEYMKSCYIDKTTNCPDLILLDLNMPVMNGFEMLEKLNTLGLGELISTTIAVLTTSDHPKDRAYLEKLGVKKVLQKPLTNEKIMTLIEFNRAINDHLKI